MKAGVPADQAIGKVVTPFGKAIIYAGRYPAGGAIAVQLIADDALPESIARFSTNLVPYGAQLAEEEFCVKTWSENAPLVGPMLATGLFEDTGKRFASGFVVAPVWRVKDPARVPAPANAHEVQPKSSRRPPCSSLPCPANGDRS